MSSSTQSILSHPDPHPSKHDRYPYHDKVDDVEEGHGLGDCVEQHIADAVGKDEQHGPERKWPCQPELQGANAEEEGTLHRGERVGLSLPNCLAKSQSMEQNGARPQQCKSHMARMVRVLAWCWA